MFSIPQVNNTQLTRKDRELWNITTKALLHLGVILVVDVFFHYLYILTIPSDMKLVTKLSDWCLGELDICNNNRSGTSGTDACVFVIYMLIVNIPWRDSMSFSNLFNFLSLYHL